MLAGFGKTARATVTSIRREGGERAEGIAGRYTYVIAYQFSLEDGREISGHSKQIRDGVFLKADGTGSISVKYFETLPFINERSEEANNPIRNLILIGVGIFLIWIINYKAED